MSWILVANKSSIPVKTFIIKLILFYLFFLQISFSLYFYTKNLFTRSTQLEWMNSASQLKWKRKRKAKTNNQRFKIKRTVQSVNQRKVYSRRRRIRYFKCLIELNVSSIIIGFFLFFFILFDKFNRQFCLMVIDSRLVGYFYVRRALMFRSRFKNNFFLYHIISLNA